MVTGARAKQWGGQRGQEDKSPLGPKGPGHSLSLRSRFSGPGAVMLTALCSPCAQMDHNGALSCSDQAFHQEPQLGKMSVTKPIVKSIIEPDAR